jgi:hypothetical protein
MKFEILTFSLFPFLLPTIRAKSTIAARYNFVFYGGHCPLYTKGAIAAIAPLIFALLLAAICYLTLRFWQLLATNNLLFEVLDFLR